MSFVSFRSNSCTRPVDFSRWKVSMDRLFPGVASAYAKMSNCQLLSASCIDQTSSQDWAHAKDCVNGQTNEQRDKTMSKGLMCMIRRISKEVSA